jgi:hypothetical protein
MALANVSAAIPTFLARLNRASTEKKQNCDKLCRVFRDHVDVRIGPSDCGELGKMRRVAFWLWVPVVLWSLAAAAEYRITGDHGGLVDRYKVKYAAVRDHGERVVIDGVCNSACTLVLGIVPLSRICVTPRASLGFHMAYYDKAVTFGIKVLSYEGTADVMAYYPQTVKEWISRHGGLTADMKKVKNGPALWAIVDPCPEEFVS